VAPPLASEPNICLASHGATSPANGFDFSRRDTIVPLHLSRVLLWRFDGFRDRPSTPETGGEVELVILLDPTHPNAYRGILYRLREKWKDRSSTPQFVRALVAALNSFAFKGSIVSDKASSTRAFFDDWLIEQKATVVAEDIRNASPRFLDGEGEEFWPLVMPLYHKVYWSYRPRRIECRGLLLAPQDADYKENSSASWSKLFGRGLEIISFPGDHDSILRARELNNVLQRSLYHEKTCHLCRRPR
jgi:hypothetical protein